MADFWDAGSTPCCMEMLHMMWMNGSSSSMNSRRMKVGSGSSEQDLGGDWMRNLRTSSMEQSRNETNDASVSLVNVGGSAVDVSSRNFSTLSRKKSDSDSAEMPSDAGGWLARSFCWRPTNPYSDFSFHYWWWHHSCKCFNRVSPSANHIPHVSQTVSTNFPLLVSLFIVPFSFSWTVLRVEKFVVIPQKKTLNDSSNYRPISLTSKLLIVIPWCY